MIDYDTLFTFVDDFCQGFEPWYQRQMLSDDKPRRLRSGQMRLSEVVTILIAYHQSGRTCLKYFYLDLYVRGRHLFPHLVSYPRFVTLIKRAFPALLCLLKSLQGEVTEYLFIDATPIAVCHNLRINRHRVFHKYATRGHTSTGWFYGMKLHLVFNTQGEMVRFMITPGHVDDRTPVRDLLRGIKARLIGDRGYVSQALFDDLFDQGVTLITKIKKRMKNRFMSLKDKAMLQRRGFIETIFSSLKSLGTFVHHRHRCPINACAHLLAGLINYQLRDDKPTLNPYA